MQSRRDQVEAQTYLLSRLTGALVSADPDAAEPPTRRDSRGFVISVVMALLFVAVIAAIALFSSHGSTVWKQPNTLIVDKGSGSRYLLVGGQLRPVVNLASARLLVGSTLNTVSVKSGTLKNIPRGDPIGIPGAPDSLPQPALLNAGAWRVCATTSDTELAGFPSVRLVSDLGAAPSGARFGAGQGLLVDVPQDAEYLLWHGETLKLAQPWVSDVLGWGTVHPLIVPASWLALLPAGPPLAPGDVAGRGQAGPPIDGRPTTIGQLFHAANGPADSPYYLLQHSGLTALTATEYLLTSAQDGAAPVTSISAAGLAAAPRSAGPSSADAELPVAPPDAVQAQPGQVPCIEFPGRLITGRADLVWAGLPGGAHPSVTPSSEVAPGTQPERAVWVRPGGGSLVQIKQTAPGADPSVLLVSDTGTVYPLAGVEAIRALGYDVASAVAVPAGFVGLLPQGPLLSASASP